MQIYIGNIWCIILNDYNPSLIDYLYSVLSYRPKNYFFMHSYQNGKWDGYIRCFDKTRKRFRRGLLLRVIKLLQKYNIEFEIVNENNIYANNNIKRNYELRDYQNEAIEKILKYRYGIIKLPPRAGKTIIAIDTVRRLKLKTIFFTRSLDLMYQTYEKFKIFAPELSVGYIGDGIVNIGKDVNIITIQSSYLAYDSYLKEVPKEKDYDKHNKQLIRNLIETSKVVFYDEAHHSKSSTSDFILKRTYMADLRIGLTATPISPDENPLQIESVIGPIIYEITYEKLINLGYLMKPDIVLYDLPLFIENSDDLTYREVYNKAVINNIYLNTFIKKIVFDLISSNNSCVIQVNYVKHAKILAKLLNCDFLIGSDTTEKRNYLIKKLENKEILCLVSTLFNEGIDIPSLSYTINLSGGLSFISTLQKMRSLTISEHKNKCGVIDFIFKEHYLNKHSKERKKIYENYSGGDLFIKKLVLKNGELYEN